MSFKKKDFSVFDDEPKAKPSAPTVVVVDDDPDVLEALAFVLRDVYSVKTAASGEIGLALIDHDTAAVVLDVKMANMDGFETCEKLRENFKHLPVVFHSAYQDRRSMYDVLNKLHPFAFLNKGEPASVILKTVADAVDHDRFRRECNSMQTELQELQSRLAKMAKGEKK